MRGPQSIRTKLIPDLDAVNPDPARPSDPRGPNVRSGGAELVVENVITMERGPPARDHELNARSPAALPKIVIVEASTLTLHRQQREWITGFKSDAGG
jgi:hypothetical protein